MEQRGSASPYFPAADLRHLYTHPFWPEMAPRSPSYDDHQTLALLALSRLNLSSDLRHQPPPFRHPAGVAALEAEPLMGCYYNPLDPREQQVNSVALMMPQNGGVVSTGSKMGFYNGPDMDSVAGPGGNLGRGGGTVDIDVLNQWHCGYYDHDLSLQCKKLVPRNMKTLYSNLPVSGDFDGLIDGLVLKNSDIRSPNSYTNRQFYQRRQQMNLLSIEDFSGKIVTSAKDQNASKILQMKMEEANKEEIDLVLCEVIDYVVDLMKNEFGSYFIRKLFGVCDEEQRTRIVVAVTKSTFQLIGVCLNAHGAKAMQKLLENLKTPQQICLIMSALSPAAVALANNPNGQHLIQYCIKYFSYGYNKHLLKEIAENCFWIAMNKSGCCVLQSCVEHSHGEPKERIINQIIANAVLLAGDPYGNYVVQHLLERRIPEVTTDLIRRLQGYFASLSCNKYASNVVQKFLTESGEKHANKVVMELLASSNASMLLLDPFGNFVIQSALSVSKGHVHNALVNLIRANAPSMKSNIYGKKILAWFDKRNAASCIDM